MLGAVPLWLHLVGATIWVGSQIMMFVVVVPSLRSATDAASRHQVLTGITRRFGYLGFGALLLLVLSGLDNIDRYSPPDMFEFRYGYILAVKIAMVAVVVVLTAVHTFVVGPALLAYQGRAVHEQATLEPNQLRRLRLRSIALTSSTLLLSLAIVFCAALLRSSFAFESA